MSQFIFPPLTASLDSEQTNGGSLPAKQMVMAGFDSTATRALLTDSSGRLEINAVVSLPLPSGAATAALQTAGNDLLNTIDADTSILSAAIKNIQSAQGTTDPGLPALVVRNDTLADLSGADGDYSPLQVNATGALYTVLSAGTASIGSVTLNANSGVDIGDVDVTSLPALPAGTNTIGKVDVNAIAPVDFLDAGVLDSSTSNIISTGTTGTVVVSTLAADCTEIEIQEDIGEFMSLRVGGTVKAYLPLGGGRVKVSLPATSAVQLYSETGTTINSGKIAINFLG